MGESGSFRTSMRGFHKQDVLNYIDGLQAAHVQETEALRHQAEEAQEQLSAAGENKAVLQQKVEELEAGLEACRQQADRVPELQRLAEERGRQLDEVGHMLQSVQQQKAQLEQRAEEAERRSAEQQEAVTKVSEQAETLRRISEENRQLKEELEALRRQAEVSSSGKEALNKENMRLSEENRRFGHRLAELEAENKRYTDMVGDVGAFIVEIRSLGQSFLEAAYKRSEGCLDALDDAVAELECQVGEAKTAVEDARTALSDCSSSAGVRLEELVQKLEDAASAMEKDSVQTAGADGAAAPDAGQFFR